jgi:hypothetical protein
VATRVGGIQDQIEDGRSGYLVDPFDLRAFGERVSSLLQDSHAAERMGEAARARVRDLFLGARHLGQYADPCSHASAPRPDARRPPRGGFGQRSMTTFSALVSAARPNVS